MCCRVSHFSVKHRFIGRVWKLRYVLYDIGILQRIVGAGQQSTGKLTVGHGRVGQFLVVVNPSETSPEKWEAHFLFPFPAVVRCPFKFPSSATPHWSELVKSPSFFPIHPHHSPTSFAIQRFHSKVVNFPSFFPSSPL